MDAAPTQDVTSLLQAWNRGNKGVLDRLLPRIADDLHQIARHHLRRERGGHTLQPTALVNELYLKLVDRQRASWKDRAHFLAFAARSMRRILVDHARARQAVKRGNGLRAIRIDSGLELPAHQDLDLIALDDALKSLARRDPRQSRIVELRFFAGLSTTEAAEALGIGVATVGRDWAFAKAWLFRELSHD